ncbi:hypothetical protein B0H21DRAFT_406514 [Amylocystis lapponica]|nr:hypothetical protein B0H21DRAFT_406514 [Amylocystis lapponica]
MCLYRPHLTALVRHLSSVPPTPVQANRTPFTSGVRAQVQPPYNTGHSLPLHSLDRHSTSDAFGLVLSRAEMIPSPLYTHPRIPTLYTSQPGSSRTVQTSPMPQINMREVATSAAESLPKRKWQPPKAHQLLENKSCSAQKEEEVHFLGDVARFLRHQQRANASLYSRNIAIWGSTDDGCDLPDLVDSNYSSPASSCATTPTVSRFGSASDHVVGGPWHFNDVAARMRSPPVPRAQIRSSKPEVITAHIVQKPDRGYVIANPPSPRKKPARPTRSQASRLNRGFNAISHTSRGPSTTADNRGASSLPSESNTVTFPLQRLAPLPRFNPLVRLRAESLSVLSQSSMETGSILDDIPRRTRHKSLLSALWNYGKNGRRGVN